MMNAAAPPQPGRRVERSPRAARFPTRLHVPPFVPWGAWDYYEPHALARDLPDGGDDEGDDG